MPNHITNVFDVLGKEKDVEAFCNKVYRVEKATEKSWNQNIGDDVIIFDFNKTVPMPESMDITSPAQTAEEKKIYAENKAKYGAGDWHEWSIKNYSTKWGAYDAEAVEKIEGGLCFRFLTAWSPPSQWVETTASQFPSLIFIDHWKDEGGGCGVITVHTKNGKTKYEEQKISDHEWYIKFDSAYREEYELITVGKYEDVLSMYENMEEPNYSSLNKFLLKRLEDKDLPLFLHFEWYNEKNNFEARLKRT